LVVKQLNSVNRDRVPHTTVFRVGILVVKHSTVWIEALP
jgi:hypothetical protein